MTRAVTQIVLGLMLLFGMATLIPNGILHIRLKNTAKGIMYIIMGVISAFFSLLAFGYAYTLLNEI